MCFSAVYAIFNKVIYPWNIELYKLSKDYINLWLYFVKMNVKELFRTQLCWCILSLQFLIQWNENEHLLFTVFETAIISHMITEPWFLFFLSFRRMVLCRIPSISCMCVCVIEVRGRAVFVDYIQELLQVGVCAKRNILPSCLQTITFYIGWKGR